ncbi:MAG TPA: hypothetical protein VFE10_18935 [Phenylobacterium sp.]|jgi:hypothetical protein|nr:hypothetical protein [Phenylobacterium sp.]
MTPFLILVIAGFVAFIVGLGAVWARQFITELKPRPSPATDA